MPSHCDSTLKEHDRDVGRRNRAAVIAPDKRKRVRALPRHDAEGLPILDRNESSMNERPDYAEAEVRSLAAARRVSTSRFNHSVAPGVFIQFSRLSAT